MKQKKNYAFIDSQNLNLSILHEGWKLDFKRFRIFLEKKYNIKKVFLFIGNLPENELLYFSLKQMGYHLVFKPTLKSKKGIVKGNCDAELVMHCMLEYKNFKKAIIVSGDGDFYCLMEKLIKDKKLLKVGIPNRKHYSALLKKFRSHFFFVSDLKHKLEYKRKKGVKKKRLSTLALA